MEDFIIFLIVTITLCFVVYRQKKKKKKAVVETSELSITEPIVEEKRNPAVKDIGVVYPYVMGDTLFSVKYIDFNSFPTDFDIESEVENFVLRMQVKAEERNKSMLFQYVPCGSSLLIIGVSV